MATKTTNKTIWTLVLCAVLVFLVWKLWPTLKNAIGGGSSSGGSGGVGGVGGSGGYPYYPQQQQGGGLPLSLGSGGFGGGGSNSGGFNNPYFGGPITAQNALDSFLSGTDQLDNSGLPDTIGYDADVSQQGYDADSGDTIPYEPLSDSGGLLSSFENWFSTYSQPVPGTGIGPTTADTDEYDQIQSISDSLSDLQIGAPGQSDTSSYNPDGYDLGSSTFGYGQDEFTSQLTDGSSDEDVADSGDDGDGGSDDDSADDTFGYGSESTGDAGGYFD